MRGPGDASTLHVAQARLTGAQSQLQLSPAPPDVSDIGCVSPGVFPFPWLSPCFKLVSVTSGPSNCLLTGLLPLAAPGNGQCHPPPSTADTCCSNTRHGSLGPSDQNPNHLACICGPETSSPGFALFHPSLLLRLGSIFSLPGAGPPPAPS